MNTARISSKGGREKNEDAIGRLRKDGMYCFVLADGLGGQGGGETASSIAVKTILECFDAHAEVSKEIIYAYLEAAQNAIIAIGGMIITAVVNGYGVAFIGGYTAANKLYGILEIAATSYGYAMITYVGQNLGAGKIQRIRKGMGCATVVAVATSLVIAAVMLIFGEGIVGAFISGTAEEIAEATRVGYIYLVYMSVCLPVLYILHVTRSAVQGMGNTVLPMVSGIAEFVMRTGGVLMLPMLLGEQGVFLAEVLAWMGADVILIPSYFITLKKLQK